MYRTLAVRNMHDWLVVIGGARCNFWVTFHRLLSEIWVDDGGLADVCAAHEKDLSLLHALDLLRLLNLLARHNRPLYYAQTKIIYHKDGLLTFWLTTHRVRDSRAPGVVALWWNLNIRTRLRAGLTHFPFNYKLINNKEYGRDNYHAPNGVNNAAKVSQCNCVKKQARKWIFQGLHRGLLVRPQGAQGQ